MEGQIAWACPSYEKYSPKLLLSSWPCDYSHGKDQEPKGFF